MPIRVSPLPLPPRDHENYLELFLPASGHRSCFLETLRQLEAIFSQSIPSEAISPDRRVIVEIGSLCNPHRSSQEYDGWSTLCFGWYAAATGAEFHTVDISEAHQQACQSVLENYSTQVNYHLAEGANFLQTFSKPIDLLYVDAWGNNPAHQDTHYVESYRSLIDKPGLILIKGVGEERAAETGRRGLVRQALFDGYQIAFQSSKHLLLQKGDTDTLEQTTDGGIAQTLAFNLDAPINLDAPTKGVGDQVQKLTDANAAPQALPSLCSVLKTDPAKRKPPLLRLSSQQMYTRSYPMRVVSDSCGDFKSLSDTNILIYWPHGFGDWVFLSYVLPFLNPTNRYWVTRFGDDSPSVFDGSDFATPLYMGTNSPHCNDGGSFDNHHFGLRHEAVDGEEQLLSLPLALADQCNRLGIDTFFWSGHPEIHGRVAPPFHTKARYLLPALADSAILAQAQLDRPLPSAINFHVPSWLTQWVEGRLQSFTGYGPRKLCLISRNGYTATGKNWGHMWREDLPQGKRREGEECRDFMRLLLKKDPHWLFLVTEDILFDGDSTVRSEDLHAYSYAQVFGSIGAATPPFGLIMKTLLNLSDLVVGVPAGPYHLSMAKPDLPTVGLWVEHLPSWYDEPKEASRHLISRNVADRGFRERPGSFDTSGGLNFSSRWLDTRIIPGEQVFEAVEELLYPESWQLRQSSSYSLESREVSPLPDTELLLDTELPPDFESLEAELKDSSILGEAKLRVMHRYLKDIRILPGEAAELGVYRGGTARLIARMLPGRSVHLFDTFNGLPAPGENDLHAEGDFSDTSLEAVQSVLTDLKNVHLYKGLFPATLLPSLSDHRFCFVHCDGDLYQSTQDFLEFFYPRMVKGGVMIFDDYHWAHCPGVSLALDAFLADKPEQVQVDQQYQAIVIKL